MDSLAFPRLLALVIVVVTSTKCDAGCYFSSELQGSFLTQSTITDNDVHYSQVNITEDAIPIWGQCHKRIENNVILMIGSDETVCFRCFHLKLVARNVLRVHTSDKDYISKCYTNENKAIASCPTSEMLQDAGRHTEIILFKTLEFDGSDIRREYCPINGRYKLTYNVDDGLEDKMECPQPDSELDNCPSGSAMNLRFRKCSFENHEITFECLGHWQGLGDQKYLALMNSKTHDRHAGPQYRCATYTDNTVSGAMTISFSNDSTCTSMQMTNSAAFPIASHTETIALFPVPHANWPHTIFCSYPDWMPGHWEHMVIDQSTIVYKDHSSFKTYTMKCIENEVDSEKFLVFSRSQCGEETYNCIWTKKRSANILEFQIGTRTGSNASMIICDDAYFDDSRWLTQGRLDHNLVPSPCPVNGEFTGLIPDASGLCAKLSSECTSPDMMHYQVSACLYDEVYEEREYRCLGQWEENGLVYTYTKRQDVGTYECFVGGILSDNKIYIKEAGEHCQRHADPYRYGMELNKVAYCNHTVTPPQIVHGVSRHDVAHGTDTVGTTLMPSHHDHTYAVEQHGNNHDESVMRGSTTTDSTGIGESVFPDVAPPSVVMPNTGGQPRHNEATATKVDRYIAALTLVVLALLRTLS